MATRLANALLHQALLGLKKSEAGSKVFECYQRYHANETEMARKGVEGSRRGTEKGKGRLEGRWVVRNVVGICCRRRWAFEELGGSDGEEEGRSETFVKEGLSEAAADLSQMSLQELLEKSESVLKVRKARRELVCEVASTLSLTCQYSGPTLCQ